MRPLGATYLGDDRCQFVVWAPLAQSVGVRTIGHPDSTSQLTVGAQGQHAEKRFVLLERAERGYHQGIVDGIQPGASYLYRLDGQKERPDPASRFQPTGVHQPSQIVDHGTFPWNDPGWRGLSLDDYIIYELHVGTYTPEGTFDAIIPYLDELVELGVTAIELMPIAQFSGTRNWGYDGVYPFAVQNSYGGPEGLKRLVDACHQRKLAVVLDIVYNHLGPEGNYLGDFGPYFTGQYRTPWGQALNYDGPQSDEVVRYFVENAIHWVRDFHIDSLRLDAIHGIVDRNAQPFLQLLAESVREFAREVNRHIYLIAESDFNDIRFIRPREAGGYGLDAQWSDDLHHALHTLLTEERTGYYLDFGKLEHLMKAVEGGFVYTGQYSAYRRRRHGNSSRSITARQLVVFAQNHDQVGNRAMGDRLSSLVSFEALKLAAGIVLLSPYVPLLFMGEEYGERAPFQYFTSHTDSALIEAVRAGRRKEFAAFGWQGKLPDPQDESTLSRSRLDHALRCQEPHRTLWEFYKELIALRHRLPSLALLSKEHLEVRGLEGQKVLQFRRWSEADEAVVVANFGHEEAAVALPVPPGSWRKVLDSADIRWNGGGGSVPKSLNSKGEVPFRLPSKSLLVLSRS